MSEQVAYSAVLTLTPPSDNPVAVHIQLLPHDSVDVAGVKKRLGDCTLSELRAYADELESAVAETYHDITIRELLIQPDFGVAVDAVAEDWLDHVVVLAQDDAVSAEIDPIAEAVAASEVADAIKPQVDVLEDDLPVVLPVVLPIEEAEEEAEFELIPIEELPPPEITIAAAEPIHEERLTGSNESINVDPKPETRTAGILPNGNYPARNAVAIWFDEEPMRLMQGHARSSLRREVAGMMIGPRPEKQPDGRYMVHVTDMIIAKHTKMSGASVTYTPESWRYMSDKLAEMYPEGDHVMVGWYHTHPGFGIFLSNMDLFIHMNFFTQKWHIAYVLDPVGFKSGFFSWDKAQTEVTPYGFAWPEWMNGSW